MTSDIPVTGTEALRRWLAEAWAREPRLFAADVEGAQIACRGWNLDATDLPGIVLVHGFRAHARWWDHIAPWLAATHRVVALDLSGMGDSGRRPAYAREQLGREIFGAAEAAGIARPIVIAHSFGAVCAMLACRTEPGRAARLIIIDSALPMPEDDEHQIPVPPRRVYASREDAVARFRLLPPGEWPHPDILAYIAHHAVREDADGWTWKFDDNAAASLNREQYRDGLFGQTVPFDIVHGELTELMHAGRLTEALRMAPHSGRPIAVPGAHHHVMIEQPMALVATLRALLANDKG